MVPGWESTREHIFLPVGQRKGLNVGGKAEPLFVISTDVKNNRIYVGQGQSVIPDLFRPGLKIMPEEIHWIRRGSGHAGRRGTSLPGQNSLPATLAKSRPAYD